MTHARRSEPSPVLIAGSGLAASVLAIALRARGFPASLLARGERRPEGAASVEILPEQVAILLAQLGCAEALRRAGAVVTEGFENGWVDPRRPTRLAGHWVHVGREALARELLAEAVARGAQLLALEQVPRDRGEVVAAAGEGLAGEPFAVVDATGRSAWWSRPIARSGSAHAALYGGPGSAEARPGRIVRVDGGWAYLASHPTVTTVGVIHERGAGRPSPHLDRDIAGLLGLESPESFVFRGSRPACAQWSVAPIVGRSLAVGDAALAYEPIAGQGVRFSVVSALAASATLASLRDGGEARMAEDYYRSFVFSARDRHLQKLAEMRADQAAEPAPSAVLRGEWQASDLLRFAATTRPSVLQRDGVLAAGEAIVLADGGLLRWVGAFDLLLLRELLPGAMGLQQLCDRLGELGVAAGEAPGLVRWCLRRGILAKIDEGAGWPA